MARAYQDLTGQRFGRLTALRLDAPDRHGHPKWLCGCECGNEKAILQARLRAGHTQSCGCLQRETSRARRIPLAQRFAAQTNKSGPVVRPELGPCHLWTGRLGAKGYGKIRLGGKHSRYVAAHRVAFFLAHGTWPTEEAMHKCDVRSCVREDHIVDGSHLENIRDCVTRGRHVALRGEASGRAKLTEDDVRAIRSASDTYEEIAKRYGITKYNVAAVRLRKTWKHVA